MVGEKKSFLRSLYIHLSSKRFSNFIKVTFPQNEKDTGDWVITISSRDPLPGAFIKVIAKKDESTSGKIKIFLNHIYWLNEKNNYYCLENQNYWLNPESLKIFEFNREGEEAEIFLYNLYQKDSVVINKIFAFFNKVKEKKFFQYNSDIMTAV